jgi:hypothetical protein
MKYFRYYGYIYGDQVAGLVKANDEQEAEQILAGVYHDYDEWSDKKLTEVNFDDGTCEVFYG